MKTSKIEWTESTWNPLTGCTKVSPGCVNCYAEKMAFRLQAMGQANYINGFQLTIHEQVLEMPLNWKKPQMIFVNSMSDLFHEDVPESFIRKAFDVMRKASWHTFQILTKRSDRLRTLNEIIDWPKNVWMGVSVESERYNYRIENLESTDAQIKFISFEPLLNSIGRINLKGIDWVIVGGESGPKARPMLEDWVTELRDQCNEQSTPFFFKQWGGVNKKKTGRLLEGKTYDELPVLCTV